jgi:exonuclease V gamma subunit
MVNLKNIPAEVRTFCDFYDLVRGLGTHLKKGQGMPFTRDIILVDGRAQSNWLTHALLNEGGMQVHMNADMMTTRRFSSWLVSQVRGLGKTDSMPFDVSPSLIYNLLSPESLFAEDWRQFNGSEELARCDRPGISSEERQAVQVKAEMVRWRLSYRLAAHFRELLRNDPEWIRRAESGSVGGQDTRWSRLWRRLSAQVRANVGSGCVHEVDVLSDLQQDNGRGELRRLLAARLPGRITLVTFGDIPLTILHILAALARSDSAFPVEVVIFHFQPTPGFHLDLGQPRSNRKFGTNAKLLWLGEDDSSRPTTLNSPGVPLLAYAGRFFRQQQQKLCDVFDSFGPDTHSIVSCDTPTTLLGCVQKSIQDFETAPQSNCSADGSVTIHRCHGPRREVEVLREELLRAFAADSSLRQGDVLILSPNPELYAPLLESGLNGREPHIKVKTAAMYGTRNSAFGAATKALLDLPEGRVTANEVFNLLSMRAIQAKHDWSVEQLEAVWKWFKLAPMFWGVDFEHRKERAGQDAKDKDISRIGTLDDFIKRIAVGTATGSREFIYDKGSVSELIPLAAIEGREYLRLASQVLETLTVIRDWTRQARTPATLSEWLDRFQTAIRILPQDNDYLAEYRELCQSLEQARRDADRFSEPILHGLFREIIISRCEFSAGAGQFMLGATTLAPLRAASVHPAKVIVLLGMNDGAFPSQSKNIGPEVARPSDGEVAVGASETFSLQALRASEDSSAHAFLLLLAAVRNRLIITFDGYIGDSGKPAAPATPVEMLERLCSSLVGKRPKGEFLIHSHGLMEFQCPLGVTNEPPKTFDKVVADVADALVAKQNHPILEPTTKADLESMDDEQWLALWSTPADYALSELNVAAPQPYYRLSDAEPLEYSSHLVGRVFKYARDRFLKADNLKEYEKELILCGLLPVAEAEKKEVLSQAEASLKVYEGVAKRMPTSPPLRKFREKFWVNRGLWVRKAVPLLKVVEPKDGRSDEIDFITDEQVEKSPALELSALAYLLRRNSFGVGQSRRYNRVVITGMPTLVRGADTNSMKPISISLEFTDKALGDDAKAVQVMRSHIMSIASHILSKSQPLYIDLLADILKDSYEKSPKFSESSKSKKPKASKSPKALDSVESSAQVSATDSFLKLPPPPRFEQKGVTGDHGAACEGANRYILPENIDLVEYAKNFEVVFESGLIKRSEINLSDEQ